VSGGDEGEGTWLWASHTCKNRTIKPLTIAFSGVGRELGGEMVGIIYPMYNVRLFRIVTVNSPIQRICPGKNGKATPCEKNCAITD
jgi:hypothetical protein